jgi:hypothetical protein
MAAYVKYRFRSPAADTGPVAWPLITQWLRLAPEVRTGSFGAGGVGGQGHGVVMMVMRVRWV